MLMLESILVDGESFSLRRDDRRAESRQRRPQGIVRDLGDALLQIRGFRSGQRPPAWGQVLPRPPCLFQRQAGHGAIAEKTVDPLQQDRFAVLYFQRDPGRDS